MLRFRFLVGDLRPTTIQCLHPSTSLRCTTSLRLYDICGCSVIIGTIYLAPLFGCIICCSCPMPIYKSICCKKKIANFCLICQVAAAILLLAFAILLPSIKPRAFHGRQRSLPRAWRFEAEWPMLVQGAKRYSSHNFLRMIPSNVMSVLWADFVFASDFMVRR